MKFCTETGSVYEVDDEGKRFRRCTQNDPETAYREKWRSFVKRSAITRGLPVTFDRSGEQGPGHLGFTQTSPVTAILEGP